MKSADLIKQIKGKPKPKVKVSFQFDAAIYKAFEAKCIKNNIKITPTIQALLKEFVDN